jgi:hypothetical protein
VRCNGARGVQREAVHAGTERLAFLEADVTVLGAFDASQRDTQRFGGDRSDHDQAYGEGARVTVSVGATSARKNDSVGVLVARVSALVEKSRAAGGNRVSLDPA